MEEVIEDFRRNTGTQFDSEIIIAFCRALLKEVNGETRERQFTKLLGKGFLNKETHAQSLAELIAELEASRMMASEMKSVVKNELEFRAACD